MIEPLDVSGMGTGKVICCARGGSGDENVISMLARR